MKRAKESTLYGSSPAPMAIPTTTAPIFNGFGPLSPGREARLAAELAEEEKREARYALRCYKTTGRAEQRTRGSKKRLRVHMLLR